MPPGVGLLALVVLEKSDACSTDSSERDSNQVSHNSFDGPYNGHFKSTGPPGTDRDERFRGAYDEMCQEGNDRGHNDGGVARQEKKRNNRNQRPQGCRESPRNGGGPGFAEPFFCGAQSFSCECPDELRFIAGDLVDKTVGVFLGEPTDLIA